VEERRLLGFGGIMDDDLLSSGPVTHAGAR
jgi:hypothetical protein